MKKTAIKLLGVAAIFGMALPSVAQTTNLNGYFYGQDAFRFSNQKIAGTARMQGMGGTYSSLGADASNAFANPAGLGFYNRSEFSITPVFSNSSATSSYLGTASSLSSSKMSIGQASAVFNNGGVGTRKKSSSFAISYNRLIDFNSDINYAGQNEKSSMMDSFVETANAYGATPTELDNEFDPNTGLAYSPAALYYQTYMLYSLDGGGYEAYELSTPVDQNGRFTEQGSVGQWNLSYGVNFDDKTYLGGGIGLRTLTYSALGDHTDVFPNATEIKSFDYYDDLSVSGVGVNLSLGAIIKATKNVQFGLNVITPTRMSLNETYREGITVRPVPGGTIETNFPSVSTVPNEFGYRVTTPLQANFGTTVFLPKKIGFVTADVEYMGYKNMRVRDTASDRWTSDQNTAIQSVYKDVINFKLGSELRFNNMRVRGGANFLSDPYTDQSVLDRSQQLYSLGVGYRDSRFFADVAGVFTKYNTAYTPYTLSDPTAYASAFVDNKRSNFVISVGAFF